MDETLGELTEEDIALLRKYETFYKSLDNGDRIPSTEAQRHFVAVCNRRANITTAHERAWMRYKNKKERDKLVHEVGEKSNDNDVHITTEQPAKKITREEYHERNWIMDLVRTTKQPYERLMLIIDNASRIGLSSDDILEIRNQIANFKFSGVSSENFIVEFSKTDGQ